MFSVFVSNVRGRTLSLVAKLMLLYSFSTVGLLFVIGLFLYPTFIKMLTALQGYDVSSITVECYEKFIVILLLGVLVSIILGYFIAYRGLRRMRQFESSIERITAVSLHERITIDEWPKELRSLGNKFNTMLNRLEISFVKYQQIASDMAHEFRTPIHNLRHMTEAALCDTSHTPKCHELLIGYMSEFEFLSKMIDSLLFLARSDHGQIVLQKELVDVRELVLSVCEYYQLLADEQSVTLTCHGNAQLSVDPILFKRVMSNILSNALKYTPREGVIAIDIHDTYITICDTGIGIAEVHLPHIFDRFYRADASRAAQSGGVGLGLAIVRAIMLMHDGYITIDSGLEKGTMVTLRW